jgi:hypothetical protein
MKISIDTIGNGTRDLPACSAVLQPTAYPIAEYQSSFNDFSNCLFSLCFILCCFSPKLKPRAVTAVKWVQKLNVPRGRKSERLVSLEINDKQKVSPLLQGTSKKNTQTWLQVRTK